MPFLPPNKQRQSTEGMKPETTKWMELHVNSIRCGKLIHICVCEKVGKWKMVDVGPNEGSRNRDVRFTRNEKLANEFNSTWIRFTLVTWFAYWIDCSQLWVEKSRRCWYSGDEMMLCCTADGPGVYDPCEREPTDLCTVISLQAREDLTASAQVSQPLTSHTHTTYQLLTH